VQHSQHERRIDDGDNDDRCGKPPVENREPVRRRLKPRAHSRPEIAVESFNEPVLIFERLLHGTADPTVVKIDHGCHPNRVSSRRRSRVARNIRDFTAPTEIPSTSAISWYERSSTSARTAVT